MIRTDSFRVRFFFFSNSINSKTRQFLKSSWNLSAYSISRDRLSSMSFLEKTQFQLNFFANNSDDIKLIFQQLRQFILMWFCLERKNSDDGKTVVFMWIEWSNTKEKRSCYHSICIWAPLKCQGFVIKKGKMNQTEQRPSVKNIRPLIGHINVCTIRKYTAIEYNS